MADTHDLQRFVDAQEGSYETAAKELRDGQKRSHWMWYIFPQFAGLGRSSTAQKFAVGSLDEAKAYVKHPVLGRRLGECTQLVLDIDGRTAQQIFGYPDTLKFRSSMTLFDQAAEKSMFSAALDTYYDGEPDEATLKLLGKE